MRLGPSPFVLLPFFLIRKDSLFCQTHSCFLPSTGPSLSLFQFRAKMLNIPLPSKHHPFSTVAPPFWLTALWPQLGCLSWKAREGREDLLECRGPREAAHPKGRGAPCPSCLLRHIPGICILLAVTSWDIPFPSNTSHRQPSVAWVGTRG